MQGPEPWVWAELRSLLPKTKGGVAVDIGAHEGEWTYTLSHWFTQVWSFEAQMELAVQLAGAVPSNVNVVPLALANRPELRQFTRYANSAHLSALFDNGGIDTGEPVGKVSLVCGMLDMFNLVDVELIKIDVEGAEVDVLQGAKQIITLERPLLVIEVHTADNGTLLQEVLSSWQYGIRKACYPLYKPGSERAGRHYWLIGVP